jgi:hypothetical protein
MSLIHRFQFSSNPAREMLVHMVGGEEALCAEVVGKSVALPEISVFQ